MSIKHYFHESLLREYDIRGIVNETLFEADAFIIGKIFGTRVLENNGRSVAIGRDGRHSSIKMETALVEGLQSAGVDAHKIGECPTPQLYYATHTLKMGGGIMVTGSHNPPNYNGFKMMLGTRPFFGSDIKDMAKTAATGDYKSGLGKVIKTDIFSNYIDRLLLNINLEKQLSIVWDCGNGSAGPAVEALCKRLRGKHKILFSEVNGDFPNHHPDPSNPENLKFCKEEVLKRRFDLGIAFDGDGDRIGVVDDKGRDVPGDILLLVLSKFLIEEKKNALIIGDIKCSQVLFDEIEKIGAKSIISKTGHSHVKMNMKKYNADLAGEMSGHIFFKSNYGFDDALYASIELIKILTKSDKKLSQIIDEIPKVYNTPEIRIDCDENKKFSLIESVCKSQKKLNKNILDIDGLRVKSEDGWWLLRASNTQPGIVLRCESESQAGLHKQIENVKSAIKVFDVNLAQKILVEN